MKLLLWLLSLAALSVGARNFEQGISIDGPLYATIARNIARSGEWFRLDGFIPDFAPFAEHPHLGFWIQALIFKILPAADWSARVQGHIFYVASLALVFTMGRRLYSERAATFAVILLWSWSAFSNVFSNFYLDPGCLVFGILFLTNYARALGLTYDASSHRFTLSASSRPVTWAALAGLFLGFAFLQKGLTALGFGPVALALLVLTLSLTHQRRQTLALTTVTLGLTALTLTAYAAAIKSSSLPNFLEIYWSRQVDQRFAKSWDWSLLVSGQFWSSLSKDSLGLVWIVPLALFGLRKRTHSIILPLVLFASFLLMYAPAGRNGSQYSVMLLPPLALLLAAGLDAGLMRLRPRLQITVERSRQVTQALSLTAVLLLQYLPYPTHHPRKAPEVEILLQLSRDSGLKAVTLVRGDPAPDFLLAASFAWYADMKVKYLSQTTDWPSFKPASVDTAYLVLGAKNRSPLPLIPPGLCEIPNPGSSQLLVACSKI